MDGTRQINVAANGVDFVAYEKGEGPLVLCLHGFPDRPHTFRHQLDPLVKAGYRVVVPFMRGYAPTSPAPDGNYQSAMLGRDALALIEALGAERAVLFGHDWGALASYAAAIKQPSRIERLITAAVPYGAAFGAAFLSSYDQLKRSWYIYFFQSPAAESVVGADDCRFIRRLWQDWYAGQPPKEEVDAVCALLADPNVLQAAITYYRCMLDPAFQKPELAAEQAAFMVSPVEVPTLYLHGSEDACMGVGLTEGMEAAFPAGLTKVVVEGAGHFLQQERPEAVNEAVLAFLQG